MTPAGVFLRRMGTTEPSWSGTSGSGTAQRSRSAAVGERASGAPSLPLSVVLEAPPPGARRCGCSRLASSSALSAGPPPHASSSGLGETLAPLSPTLPAPPPPASMLLLLELPSTCSRLPLPPSSILYGWGSHRAHWASVCKVTAATLEGGALSPALQVTPLVVSSLSLGSSTRGQQQGPAQQSADGRKRRKSGSGRGQGRCRGTGERQALRCGHQETKGLPRPHGTTQRCRLSPEKPF